MALETGIHQTAGESDEKDAAGSHGVKSLISLSGRSFHIRLSDREKPARETDFGKCSAPSQLANRRGSAQNVIFSLSHHLEALRSVDRPTLTCPALTCL